MSEIEIKENNKKYGLVYYTKGEEIANTITHGLGVVFAFVALGLMLAAAENASGYASAVLFFLGAFIVYGTSAVYHAVSDFKIKSVLRKLDHSDINFLVISCGITMCLMTSNHIYNYIALALCYGISILSYILCFKNLEKYGVFIVVMNFVTGALLTSVYIFNRDFVSERALYWFIAGTTLCILGTVLYGIKRKYVHSAFHVFELLGTVAYFMANYMQMLK